MKIGLSLDMLHPAVWSPLAELADELGFESVWLPEHLVLPVQMSGNPDQSSDHPPVPPSIQIHDVFVFMGLLAGRTNRLRFGTFVYNIGLRHPFITARAVTTLEMVSDGRLELGIGASWLAEEWEAVGLDFSTRARRVDEAVRVCRRLWSEATISHEGEFFSFPPVMFEPKPIQPGGPPIHVGGDSRAARRRAATLGDGWVPLNFPLDRLPGARAEMRTMRAEHDRPDSFEVTVATAVTQPSDLEDLAALGVDRVLVKPWTRTRDALARTREFADMFLDREER